MPCLVGEHQVGNDVARERAIAVRVEQPLHRASSRLARPSSAATSLPMCGAEPVLPVTNQPPKRRRQRIALIDAARKAGPLRRDPGVWC